jgi:hypothetical protein
MLADNTGFSFDIIDDTTREPIATIGPIPSGEMKVTWNEGSDEIIITTNKIQALQDGTYRVKTINKIIKLPHGEDGSKMFSNETTFEKQKDNVYVMDKDSLVYFSSKRIHNSMPEPVPYDTVLFGVHQEADPITDIEEEFYLACGHVMQITQDDEVVVSPHLMIPMSMFRGPQGEPGKDGEDGKDGKDGKLPGIRYCLYGTPKNVEPAGMSPFSVYWLDCPYLGTIDFREAGAPLQNAYDIFPIDDNNPPHYDDIVGIVSSDLWINTNATMPYPHSVRLFSTSPFGSEDYGLIDDPIESVSIISYGPAPTDWSLEDQPPIEVMGGYVVVACLDHSELDAKTVFYTDKYGVPGLQNHKFTLSVPGVAHLVGDAEQSHVNSSGVPVVDGWGRYTYSGTEYPIVTTMITGTEGNYTTTFEITARNNSQGQAYMGVRMFYEVYPNDAN